MSEFQALLDELGTLAKAMPSGDDDKTIAAAAGADGNAGDGDGDDEDGKDKRAGEGDNDGDEDGTFGKSFAVTLEDGTQVEAFDGTEMMKSLMAQNQALQGTVAALTADRDAIGAAMTQSVQLIKSLQASVTKLSGDVSRLANSGAGRKAVVNVLDKPATTPMAKSFDGINGKELMVKALGAQREGRLNAVQVARLENAVTRGQTPPADLVRLALGE